MWGVEFGGILARPRIYPPLTTAPKTITTHSRNCIKHLFKGRSSQGCQVGRRRLCPHCLQPAAAIRKLSTAQELGRKLAALLLEAKRVKSAAPPERGSSEGSTGSASSTATATASKPPAPAPTTLAAWLAPIIACAAAPPTTTTGGAPPQEQGPGDDGAYRLLVSQAALLLTILTLSFHKKAAAAGGVGGDHSYVEREASNK